MRLSAILSGLPLILCAFAEPFKVVERQSNYRFEILDQHNLHRSNHSAPALVWDKSLENSAKSLAKSCKFDHDRAGQNIAGSAPTFDAARKTVSNQWYNGEYKPYQKFFGKEPNMDTFMQWGHLTQVLWANTTSLGCFTADCTKQLGYHFTVCNYSPAGNFGGEFARNVKPAKGQPVARP